MSFQKVFCPYCRILIRKREFKDKVVTKPVPVTCFKCGRRFAYKGDMGEVKYIRK